MTDLILPAQLQNWRFILLCPKIKIPLAEMAGWAENRETKTLTYDSTELRNHFEKGGNYAVLTDKDRFVLASDTKEVEQAIEQRLPNTFSVKSPRHKTKHFFFYGHISKYIVFKPTAEGDPCCDLKSGNAYVLGPQSVFKEFGKYEVVDNLPIATTTEEQVIAALSEFIKGINNEADQEETVQHEKLDPNLSFPIEKIIPNLNAMTYKGNKIYGPHAIHGSTTGTNFKADIKKNVWRCFRHESGGGSLELLAVKHGFLKCEDCQKGALRGELFRKTVEKAQELNLIAKNYLPPTQTDSKFIIRDPKSGKIKIDTEAVIKELKTQFIFKTPTDIEEPYYYKDGIYIPAEHMVKALTEKWLGTLSTTYFINEILGHIQRSSYVEREQFNKYNGYVPVLNGLLQLATGKLYPYSPEQIFTFKINAHYNPEAKCPKFLKFLNETLDSEDIPTLQEYTGYTLLPSMPFHKTMWFLGSGRNGKGTFIRTLIQILGPDNTAHINITQLNGERNFSEYQLYGKLINVSSEPTTQTELQTPLFKKLTGGDWIDAEVKNKQRRVRFINPAKFFILGNKYPKVNDNTVAFWERVLLLKFNGVFLEGKGQIQDIEQTWLRDTEEVSGILNWMLEGLQRLIINGKFTVSASQNEIKLDFKRVSDPFNAWIEEKTVFGLEYYIPRTAAYDDYKVYCDTINANCDSDQKFYAKMRQLPKVKDQQTTKKDETEKRFWIGLCLKSALEKQQTVAKYKGKQETLNSPQIPQKPQPPTTLLNNTDLANKKDVSEPVVSVVSVVNSEPQEPQNDPMILYYNYLPANLPTPLFCIKVTKSSGETCGEIATNEIWGKDGKGKDTEHIPFCQEHFKYEQRISEDSGFKMKLAEAS